MVEDRQRLMPEGHWQWTMPVAFSQGWKVGNMVFVGGQISADDHGRTIGVGDIEAQTRNVFMNIQKVLAEAGATMQDIVKLNTYYVYDGPPDTVTDYWEKMTRVRMEFFHEPAAAATGVRVVGLAFPDLLIEAEAIAIIPPGRMT